MARSSALGFAPDNGAISCLGDRAQKHAVVPFLSFVDFLFSEMARATTDDADNTGGGHKETNRGSFQSAAAAVKKLPLVGISRAPAAVCFVAGLFHTRDRKQAIHGHAACGARSLCLVAERTNPMGGCCGACAACANIRGCQRLDDLGTEIPRGRQRSGMGADLAGAAHHRGSRDLVLSW